MENDYILCADCGDLIMAGDEYDDPKDSLCPECGNFLCRNCADWENIDCVTMCWECAEDK